MADILNRCDEPKCEKGVCLPDRICEVYTKTVQGSCQDILRNNSITRAEQIMLRALKRDCKKTN